ncbi:hypothetical protein [Limobrevibacterium gyesilva]|uniref:Uncharacterized protein n=1 Tax=Limobrevibacterium gyesilva TaxID=2991712 RepID=A0AA41YY39_9PROT|nr:hypothetical protein [Limobrevibacterium gyesilva]MCW3477402.1 hypothetical protein [Limobrevibacterium gyesilva]
MPRLTPPAAEPDAGAPIVARELDALRDALLDIAHAYPNEHADAVLIAADRLDRIAADLLTQPERVISVLPAIHPRHEAAATELRLAAAALRALVPTRQLEDDRAPAQDGA